MFRQTRAVIVVSQPPRWPPSSVPVLASGLARTLYQAFLEMAAKDGRRRVRAVTAPVNSTSIAFHAAMGFTVTGPVGDYDGPDSAKMLFERRL